MEKLDPPQRRLRSVTPNPVICKTCLDTGWETLFGVETVKGNKASTAVRRCRRGCNLPPDEGVRVVYAPPERSKPERPDGPVSFS